jgi:Ca2+-binding RTX toxin-like protein
MTISKRTAWIIPAVFTFVAIGTLSVPSSVNAHCKGKHTGNHPHCTGGDDGSGEYVVSDGVTINDPPAPGFDYHIVGTSGNDNITAGSGTDLIEGGAGRDEITALGGNDEIYGEDGEDHIDAGEGNDLVYGGAGIDFLNGGPGTDWLEGGDGDDELYFSMGASLGGTIYEVDHLDGGLGDDMLSFGNWAGPGGYALINQVTVDLALGTYDVNVTDLFGETVVVHGTFLSIEDLWGANDGNSTLYGDSFDNRFVGGSGDDILYGRSGNDTLVGNDGHDEVYGGPGDDWVEGHPGNDLVVGGAGNDTVSGQERGWIEAGADDVLWGGDNLTLIDGEADTFHFHGTFGTDTVMDYEQDETIHLTGFVGGFLRDDMSFDVINIDPVGADIVISFWLKRGGGTGGTIILKGAAARGIVVGESNFIIE